MEKKVKIKIASRRYNVAGALFDDFIEGEREDAFDLAALLGDESEEGDNSETIEMVSEGTLRMADGRVELSYEETELTGMEGSLTSISYDLRAPGLISMIRTGSVSTVLVFEERKRHLCVYNTPYMPFELCVKTHRVENTLLRDGRIYLDYLIEIKGASAERSKFTIQVVSEEGTRLFS